MSIEETEELFELLKGLSPREQAIIRPVLERDLEFQRREKARLRQLKSYVEMSELQHRLPSMGRKAINCPLMQSISSDSMISIGSFRSNRPTIARPPPQPPSGRVCFHCHCRLGLVFNAGTRCAQCGRLLCNSCRRGTYRSKWLCQTCHTHRELRAASGEWVDGGDPAEVSELLLAQMRRAAMEKEKQEEQKNSVVHVRAPMMSRRHLTLPTIATPSLLAVPSEPDLKAINKEAAQERFWGGSPTPRAPRKDEDSLSSVRITAPTPSPSRNLQSGFHQREVIGSPVPRPDSSSPMSITPVNGDASSLPTTEVTSPTPTSRTQLPSPMSPRSPTSMIPKSASRIPVISNDNLLHPADTRLPMAARRHSSSPIEASYSTERRTNDTIGHQDVQPSRAVNSGYVQAVRAQLERNLKTRAAVNSNLEMRPDSSPTLSGSGMWQRCQPRPSPSPRTAPPKATPSWERASGGRPVDEYSARRARYRSQDHSRSISSSKGDHLEVSSCDSRRSSGISLPSRTTTHEARLYKGNHLTPTSSRDSISVNSLATETSTDACTKSSVASQASCVSPSYLGQVQLLLSYDIRTACVNVHVIQCRSLPHFGSHKPNPYVKVHLTPRDSAASSTTVLKHKTTPRKAEINPVFDQTLQFYRISKSEVERYQLVVSVWHKDLLTQNSPIGEATISLRDYDWESSNPTWYHLEAKAVGSPTGSESMEDGLGDSTHSTDVLSVGSRASARSALSASARRALFRNASNSSSTSSRNSRGVRKAVFQRKADGAEEEREPQTRSGRKPVELEHDVPKAEFKRSPSEESEVEDQATDWTIWV